MNAVPVPFDHRESGTSEERWAHALSEAETSRLDLSRYRQLVVVAAHPDDETLGAGGLIASAARADLSVTVIVATLGEMSHPRSPTHRPDDLARIRRVELFAAVGVLAPAATVRIIGLPDGELADHGAELVAAVTEAIHGDSTLLVAPFSADRHPDHEALGVAAARAAAVTGATVLEYPIWMWHWSTPDRLPAGLVRLDLAPEALTGKREALQCHHSQISALSDQAGDEPIVAPPFADHFDRGYEIFVSAAKHSAPASDAVREAKSLPQAFFDDFYGEKSDPWGFETRWYEKRKRALTLASLPRERFRNAYEPGCSVGVLTAALAQRCDRLLGTDISDAPLRIAQRRVANLPGVRLERRQVPQEWPAERFDLIVLSEVGYYCDAADLETLVGLAASSLTTDGVLLTCHWRHPVEEYPLRGDDVHHTLRTQSGLAVLAEHREQDFLLDVFVRPPAISVARATGLLG